MMSETHEGQEQVNIDDSYETYKRMRSLRYPGLQLISGRDTLRNKVCRKFMQLLIAKLPGPAQIRK
jgi:hypothetical protein